MAFLDTVKKTNNPTPVVQDTTTKTAYQQFFSQPTQKKWRLGDNPTTYGQALATINYMAKTDQKKAQETLAALNKYRTQPGSVWYDPYAAATNSAVANLKSYGIDPAQLTSDWFNQNTDWQAYLSYRGTTTTPSTPLKNASDQEKIAYNLYQYQKSLAATDAAKAEWAAAQNELSYWANRKDLNLSDDEIINKVFGSNKYSTLKKMDSTRSTGAPLELNDAIDYNDDAVHGVIWAARNGGGTGNIRQDIANYYSNLGDMWKDNTSISEKLNKKNAATYSPYEVGMTGDDMDEAGAYFGVSSFPANSIEELRTKVDWNDATSVKMFQKVVDAENTTLKAEEELANFNKAFENRMKRGFNDEAAVDKWIEDQLASGAYNTLVKMDAGILKGDPINLTRAVPYRKQLYQQKAYDAIANPPKNGADILDENGTPVSDADKSTTKVENSKINGAIDAMGRFLTTGETEYFDAVPGVEYNAMTLAFTGGTKAVIEANAEKQYGKVNGEYGNAVLSAIPTVKQYENYDAIAGRLENRIIEFEQDHSGDMLRAANVEPEVNIRLSDGSMARLVYNEKLNDYEFAGLTTEDGMTEAPQDRVDAMMGEVQEIIDRAHDRLRQRLEQIDTLGDLSPEEAEAFEQYKKDKEQYNEILKWLDQNTDAYNAANQSVNDAKAKRDAIGEIAAKHNGGEYDPTLSDAIIDYAGAFYDYQPVQADGITLIEEIAGASAADIKQGIEENNANIADIMFIMAALGDNLPDELRLKMESAVLDAERQNRVFNAYLITNDSQFDAYATAGKDSLHFDEWDMPVEGETKNWLFMMSPEEQKIYYALVGRDGIETADQYYKDIRDELAQRRQNQIEGVTKQIAESGAVGRFLGEVGAVLIAPINTAAGAAYSLGVALGADEAEMRAAKQSNHISQSMHNANITELKNIYGEDTTLGKVLTGVYEILYNRGNSLMNAVTWGKIMPHIAGDGKIASFFNDVLSATPIALSAASDALESAIDRGADSKQQAIIFASTLIAESWTEGIEFGHIENAGKQLLTKEGFLKFLKDYPVTALSEVVGETLNDKIELMAGNEWAKMVENPNYQPEHDANVARYMAEDDTLTPEQAEAKVRQDEIAGVLHTAIISAFSPSADILVMAANTVKTFGEYAKEANDYNNNATGKHAKKKSIRDIRLEHEAANAKAAEDAAKAKELQTQAEVAEEQAAETPAQPEAEPEQYPVAGPDENRTRSYTKAMDEYGSNIILLEEAAAANATAQAAAVASAINTGDTYMAQAAAAKLNLGMVQAMMVAGMQTNINQKTLALGLQFAALGNGKCADILKNGVANGLSATEMAGQIAAAVADDAQSESVAQGVTAGVHDARVNEEFKRLMATGMAEDAVKAQQKIDSAREATKVAEQDYEQKTAELDAARNGVSEAAAAIADDPINDGNQLTGALARMTSASAVAEEYAQRLTKAQKDQQKVEEDNKKTIEATTAYMRQQAEKTVSQQEHAEAQAKAEAEAQAQAEAQAAAVAEDAQRQEDNMTRVDVDTFIEQTHPNATDEQKEKIRKTFKQVKDQMGKNSDAHLARKQFEERLAKRFGLTVKHVKSVDNNGKKFTLFNARINPKTGELLINENARQDDVFYAVLVHEITHLAEKNEEGYSELANAILQMNYGEDVTYKGILSQMENGDISSKLAQDILGYKGLYDKQLGQSHTNEEMLQELIADGVGDIISKDVDALNNLVADKPSLAKRILDGIRNFLKNMVGIKSPVVTQAQKIADMLTAAIEGTQNTANTGNTVTAGDNGKTNIEIAKGILKRHGWTDSDFDMMESKGESPVPIAANAFTNEWNAAQNGEDKYSLPPVEPVEPSSNNWVRDSIQTFPELQATFPNIYNIQDDRTESQKKNDTSVAITLSTYRKIFDKLKNEGFTGTILDASSGLGLGAKAGREEYGMNVDDIEPYPNPGYTPSEGTDYSKLNKKYDVIISNAVLNVLTQDQRDALVTKMGELLNDGGRMFINVRSVGDVANLRKNLDTEWVQENGQPSAENPYTGKKNIQIGENEYYTGRGTYQKGFTPNELASYVLDVLGPGYSVHVDNKNETSGSSAAGIIVTKDDSVRYSLPSDEEYFDAIDRNDIEAVEKMVREAANQSGYTKELYHGTDAFGFTQIDNNAPGADGYSYWAADTPNASATYTRYGKIRAIDSEISEEDIESMKEDAEQKLYDEVDNFRHFIDTRFSEWYFGQTDNQRIIDAIMKANPEPGNGDGVYDVLSDMAFEAYNDYAEHDDDDEGFDEWIETEDGEKLSEIINALEGIRSNIDDIDRGNIQGGIYHLYANTDNFYVLDCKGALWNQLRPDGLPQISRYGYNNVPYKTRDVANWAKEKGYSGVLFKNIRDNGQYGRTGATNVYAFFDPQGQVKSADPITYDDDGNEIPLSERFTPYNPDLRYSLPSDNTLEQQIQQWLNENGLMNADISEAEARDLYNRLPNDGKEGNGVRQWAVKGAQASDELDEAAKQYVFANRFYKKQTNAENLAKGIKWIHSNATEDDPTGYRNSLDMIMNDNFVYWTAEGQAQMVAAIGMAAAQKDTYGQVALADAYDRQGTDLGRALQLRNIWRLMTPEGRKKSLKNMVDKLNTELKTKGKKGKNGDLKLSDWIYEAAAVAEDEGEMERVRKAAKQELAEQLPANWKDRIRSFRIFCMLANPRTHVRNILGNLLFMPAVSIKNKVGAALELAKPKGERTKTLAVRLSDDIRAFARKDADNRKGELTGDSRWQEGDSVKREQKPFTGKMSWLQKAIDANTNALEWEDWKFLKGHYARALGGWMQANGYTAADMENHPEWLEKGRAYAQQEAQKATYRDFNAVANKLNQLSRQGGLIGFLVDATLPFKKTPANIVKRGLEYSIAGLAKSLSTDLWHLHQYNVAKANGETIMPDKAISPNEFIDHFSAGLTGTAVMALGAFLSSIGVITVGLDDDDDKFEKTKGGQEYALKIRIGDDVVTYTLDWAAPMCMPFFVGAAVYEQLSDEDGSLTFSDIVNDISSIAEPVFNLSMLDGVNSLLRTNSYDGMPEITQILGKIASNYATSFVPAAFGAATRIADDYRRKAFVKSGEGGGLMGTWRYAWEQTKNKIYWAAKTNIPYRNIWGEPEGDSSLERHLENLVSPGYFTKIMEDPLIDEMERLYSSEKVSDSKRSALIPKMPNGKANGVALEPEQYDKFTVIRGQTAKGLLNELLDSDYYKDATDQEQATMIGEAWDFATQIASNQIVGAKMESWVTNSRTNPAQGIINRQKERNISDEKKYWKDEAIKAVQVEDYEALDACVEKLKEMGVSADSVKTAVGNAYKPEYIEAYQNGDRQKMIEIESILDMSGLGFDKVNKKGMDTYDQWIADMNKQISEDDDEI